MADEYVPPIRRKKKKPVAKAPAKKTVPADVKDKILGRVAREEKAYRIVERLIDNPVSCELLRKSLDYINQSIYNDIVEERSIVKNCGYPVCGNPLPAVIRKQTFGINTRLNKVYKLEERVKFCSILCFNCSRELRDQLSVDPVWLVPSCAHKGIQIVPVGTQDEADEMEELPKNCKIDDKHLQDKTPAVKLSVVKEKCPSPSNVTNDAGYGNVKPISDITGALNAQFSWLNMNGSDDSSDEDGNTKNTNTIPNLSFLETIKHCLMQWRTPQSLAYVMDTQRSNKDKDIDSDTDEDDDDYLLDEDLKVNAPENKAPLPDSKTLESRDFKISEVEQPNKAIILPKIDSVNQIQQRQNIVILRLQGVIEKILQATNYQYRDLSSVIIKLVSLFNISSSNCMFSEKQWYVIGAVVLLQTYHLVPVLKSDYTHDQFHDHLWESVRNLLSEKSEFDEICEVLS